MYQSVLIPPVLSGPRAGPGLRHFPNSLPALHLVTGYVINARLAWRRPITSAAGSSPPPLFLFQLAAPGALAAARAPMAPNARYPNPTVVPGTLLSYLSLVPDILTSFYPLPDAPIPSAEGVAADSPLPSLALGRVPGGSVLARAGPAARRKRPRSPWVGGRVAVSSRPGLGRLYERRENVWEERQPLLAPTFAYQATVRELEQQAMATEAAVATRRHLTQSAAKDDRQPERLQRDEITPPQPPAEGRGADDRGDAGAAMTWANRFLCRSSSDAAGGDGCLGHPGAADVAAYVRRRCCWHAAGQVRGRPARCCVREVGSRPRDLWQRDGLADSPFRHRPLPAGPVG